MKSCRQTASISAKDAEVGGDTGLTAHIEPYCGEDWPVSTNVYNSRKIYLVKACCWLMRLSRVKPSKLRLVLAQK